MFFLCFPMLWRLISFADKNPQAAILEGAEFLLHQQLVQGSKDIPAITGDATTPEAGKIVSLSPREIAELNAPETTIKKGVS